MVKTVMKETGMSKWENVRLQGIQMFAYFITRFNMTPDEAIAEMKEHGQDITEAKKFVYLYHLREEALKENKQKGK